MDLARKLAVLLVAVSPPAIAYTYVNTPVAAPEIPCFSTGATAYRVSAAAPRPDYRVRIDQHIQRAHLRVHFVDNAERADFVMIDDGMGGNGCGPLVKTISLTAEPARADMVVGLAPDAASADYKLFVRSNRFSQADAAALFAVMTMTTPKYQIVGQR